MFSGLYRKVKRVLSELLAEHWGEMICQTNSATVSSRYTQLFQDGIMPTAAQLNNRPTSGIDRLQQDFLDLGNNLSSRKVNNNKYSFSHQMWRPCLRSSV